METLKTSETLVEGLVASKQDGLGVPVEGNLFDFGEEKCVESVSTPVAESGGIVSNPVGSVAEIGGRVGSSSHIDVPIKGISLFVELTGGVTNDPLNHSEDRVSVVHENKGEVIVCHQECGPNVGDFVWAITKNQSWWPGIVCDASKLQKSEDGLLVRCFGNGSYVRCLPYQLKPFVAYFEQFSKQNNSKSFVGAIEKAVAEFGHRIKTEFTCSCISKKMVEEGKGGVGNLSATLFQPATFVDYVKDLARDISLSTKIDYAVNKNFLLAFYRSLGRCQMGLDQLELESIKTEAENGVFNGGMNTEENKDVSFVMGYDIKNEKSEKHYETRERRKSRFLSYPYTDVNGVKGSVSGERLTEESLGADVNGGVELNKANVQPVKKPRKKWSRKSVKKDDSASKVVQTNLSSFEVLSQLQSAAQDCLFPFQSTKFDSAERFIAGFRKWVFRDLTKEITIDQAPAPENEIGMGRTIDSHVNKTVDMVGKGTRGRPKKVRKKNEKPIPVSLPVSGTNSTHGSLIIDFQNVGSQNLETQPMANKKVEMEANQGVQNHEVKEGVSDLNGNKFTILNFGERTPCKLTPKRRKKNEPTMDPFLIHNLPQINNLEGLNQPNVFHLTNEPGLTPPCFTEPLGVSHEPKKRGRKRKTMDSQSNPGSTIMPDLNENGAEKKRGKKGKIKETGVPCVDLSYNKVQQDNEEVSGTAFLLKFSSDHPLPTQQDLNSIFCKFGALNESETQVLNDSRSGQVVFLDSSSAGEAFWGLQKDNLFGQALVNYRIQHLSGAESIGFRTPIKNPNVLLKPIDSVSMGSHLQAISSTTVIPDLNGNAAENKVLKKSKKIEEIHLPSKDLSYGSGTAVLLKFSPNHPLPSNQDLNSVFCKYGELNEYETWVSAQSLSGQVVFVNPSSAGDAVQNLEKIRPFGETLVSFRVHHLYNVQPAIAVKNSLYPLSPLSVPLKKQVAPDLAIAVKNPLSPLSVPLKKQVAPDLAAIKKNLEMMTMMMEKAGDTLSPEMRAKLESEIKGLMNKVSTMDGSSSSSL